MEVDLGDRGPGLEADGGGRATDGDVAGQDVGRDEGGAPEEEGEDESAHCGVYE